MKHRPSTAAIKYLSWWWRWVKSLKKSRSAKLCRCDEKFTAIVASNVYIKNHNLFLFLCLHKRTKRKRRNSPSPTFSYILDALLSRQTQKGSKLISKQFFNYQMPQSFPSPHSREKKGFKEENLQSSAVGEAEAWHMHAHTGSDLLDGTKFYIVT